MDGELRLILNLAWVIFFAGWLFWGLGAKTVKRRQSAASRAAQSLATGIGFWMLFSPAFHVGPLDRLVLPYLAVTPYAAIALNAAGFALAIWARLHLGANWSAIVTVKQDHRLVQSGPYGIVRHPIYSGISLAALGIAVLNGDIRSFLAMGWILLGWWMKFRQEEAFMAEEFGDAYLKYKSRVKSLIPFVW